MRTGQNKISCSRGFSLIELLVVIGMLGILSAIALPLISSTIPNYQLRAASREIVIDFKRARAEAVKRNRPVLIEFTSETAGNPEAGGSYLICVDSNGDGTCGPNDPVLRNVELPGTVRLLGFSFTHNTLGFNQRGLVLNNNSGTVTLQRNDGSRTQVISFSAAGNAQLQ